VKYKLILVPEDNLITRSPAVAKDQYVTVNPAVLYQVIADIEDTTIRMSRKMYDLIEVVDPPERVEFPGG